MAEQQSTSTTADEHEVIDARDLLAHLKRNSPANQASGGDGVVLDDTKEEVREKVRTTAGKWEQHEEALRQWRKDTAIHMQRYQPVQQRYEAYVQEKKRECAEVPGNSTGSSCSRVAPPKPATLQEDPRAPRCGRALLLATSQQAGSQA